MEDARLAQGGAPKTRGAGRNLLRLIVLALVVAGLIAALRNIDLGGVVRTLAHLSTWQLALILTLDLFVHAMVGLRWWLIVRTEDRHVPYLGIVVVRLAAFGVSYFTAGPQVGGEPVQVLYLRRWRGASLSRAISSVVLDKLLELLANFCLLLVALEALSQAGILRDFSVLPPVATGAVVSLAFLPVVYFVALTRRMYPVGRLLASLQTGNHESRFLRHARAAERLAGEFCRRHVRTLVLGMFVSLIGAGASVIEFLLITSFVTPGLTIWQQLSAWGAGWISFLFPAPGGLGALEASQVLILGAFGVQAATAIAVSLVIRARDLVFGGLGLMLAGSAASASKSDEKLPAVVIQEKL